jgi:uncharacterized RDD family membrane protein YckC
MFRGSVAWFLLFAACWSAICWFALAAFLFAWCGDDTSGCIQLETKGHLLIAVSVGIGAILWFWPKGNRKNSNGCATSLDSNII